jgi:hypothetical protein
VPHNLAHLSSRLPKSNYIKNRAFQDGFDSVKNLQQVKKKKVTPSVIHDHFD